MTADHGEARGDHGELTHGLFCYEATLHVPLFAWCSAPRRLGTRRCARAPHRHPSDDPRRGRRVADRASSRANPCWPRAARKPRPATTSRRCRRRSTAAGRLCGVCRRAGTSTSTCRSPSSTTCRRTLARRRISWRRGPTRFAGSANAFSSCRRRRPSAGRSARKKPRSSESLGYLTGSGEMKATYGPADDPKTLIGVDQTLHTIIDLCERGKCHEALPIARRVVAENPKMKLGYLHLAMVLRCVGDRRGRAPRLREGLRERRRRRKRRPTARDAALGDGPAEAGARGARVRTRRATSPRRSTRSASP